jgi:hypothetical protein
MIYVHRFEHVGDKLFDLQRDLFDARTFLPERRMTVFDNV